ncbi:NUDIX domain-containing protein [Succinimonas amylolytica]|uniref:NUDIX domain-containing protein n=1 Tax=Succinimonas amylolytica TaxID=83769 RepID=UPI0023A7A9B3
MTERFRPYVTVAAIIECRGKFLLVSEYDEAPYPVYGQPAGHLEGGEDPVAGIRREILEETGLQLNPDGLSGIYTYVKENETIQRYCFYVRDDSLPEILKPHDPDQEILNARWYSREELKELEPQFRTRLVKLSLDDYFAGARYPLSILREVRP